MKQLICRPFFNTHNADEAVRELVDAGYRPDEITVIMSNRRHGSDAAAPSGLRQSEGTIGGLLARAISLASTSSKQAPDVGATEMPLVVAGPLAQAFTDERRARDRPSALVRVIVNSGMIRDDADRLAQEVADGGILVGVSAEGGEIGRVRSLLHLDNVAAAGTPS